MNRPKVRTTEKDGEKYVNILDLVRVFTEPRYNGYDINKDSLINQLLGLLK